MTDDGGKMRFLYCNQEKSVIKYLCNTICVFSCVEGAALEKVLISITYVRFTGEYMATNENVELSHHTLVGGPFNKYKNTAEVAMKRISLMLLAALIVVLFTACSCEHEWKNATCTEPVTCSKCGVTAGDALGHKWIEANCTTPKTCSACDATEGSAVGHSWKSATCTDPKICSVCQATEGSANGHNYTTETIVMAPTCISDGEKRVACDCGAYITESIKLSTYTAEEINEQAIKYVGEIIVYDKNGNAVGVATGFVYSSDGKIITNYHVIEGAYSAQITINGKVHIIQSVLAYDAKIDLAVLKIEANNLPHATICSKEIAVGKKVYAIGSSRGLTNTFSQGIVTYYNRVVDGVSHIQHDASITNGNSGGPLINEYGEVIGINTWGLMDSQNLNFAVFTKELDNLTFGTPMSMAEFYEINYRAYKILIDWVLGNYNVSDSYIGFEICEDSDLFSVWCTDDGRLFIDNFYWYDDGAFSSFTIRLSDEETAYWYEAIYEEDGKENIVEGFIDANSFTRTSPLTHTSYKGEYWTESSVMEFHQGSAVWLLDWFNYFLEEYNVGLTMEDFGFTQFS